VNTTYYFNGNWERSNSIKILDCFKKAMSHEYKLPKDILEMNGMSGKKYRCFINNLIEQNNDSRYLEVGSWAGSTACSAFFDNWCKVTCVDNWSEFGGPKQEFFNNIKSFISNKVDFNFIECDFYKMDFSNIGKYNVYLFDGPHHEKDHYEGILKPQQALEDEYFLIIDDWNWEPVRTGTQKALDYLKSTIIASMEIRTTLDNSHPGTSCQNSDWHNGYFISYIKK